MYIYRNIIQWSDPKRTTVDEDYNFPISFNKYFVCAMAICQDDTDRADGGGYMKKRMSNKIISVNTWYDRSPGIISLNYIAIGI